MGLDVLEDGTERFVTAGGIAVTRRRVESPYEGAIEATVDGLNSRRGAVFSSNYEYPGRYTRWDTAVIDPPVAISAIGRSMRVEALNLRGEATLRRVNDVDGSTAAQRRWHIEKIDAKPMGKI